MNELHQEKSQSSESTTMIPAHHYEVPSGAGYHDEQFAKYLTPIAIILGALIISATLIFTRAPVQKTDTIAGTVDGPTASVSINDLNIADHPFIGAVNAPLTIALWTDYQCPFCKKFESETLSTVITNYVNTGKVRVVFKDFQFLGPDSTVAALVARSVWKLYPEQYFTWREAMYAAQDAENGGFGDKASILALSKSIPGIDDTKIDQDITANEETYQKSIEADRIEGTKFGVQGTPAVLIGKQIIPGALGYSDIKPLIEAELK